MTKYLFNMALGAALFIAPLSASAADTTMCTMQYQPVCGAQQVQCIKAPCYPVYHTYGNSCTLNAEHGTFIHEGECTAAESGPVKSPEPYVPPASCVAWFDGCNSCSKSAGGQAMCTLKACMDQPKPGYCTKYADVTPTKPVAPPAHLEDKTSAGATTSISSGTELATSTPPEVGFFGRIWLSVVSWFSWL